MSNTSVLEPVPQSGPPPVLRHAGPLLANYDVVFCDVWGVLHNGITAYRSAGDALAQFRTRGGTVILVSNAPVPKDRIAATLDLKHVRRDSYDDIVASGDLALARVAAQNYQRVHVIGPEDRDQALFARLASMSAPIGDADAIVCTGLVDDVQETAETYRPLLSLARDRGLPFVCANPDLVVDVGGRLYVCAGAIAQIYEDMGGDVFWAGKPHPVAYGTAKARAEHIRGSGVPTSRILAIGDAVRTDMAAARSAGVDALFIAAGIHREDIMSDHDVRPDALAKLFAPPAPPAVAAMATLVW